jgi:hypothetical protein
VFDRQGGIVEIKVQLPGAFPFLSPGKNFENGRFVSGQYVGYPLDIRAGRNRVAKTGLGQAQA